jgi:hypothetical protein
MAGPKCPSLFLKKKKAIHVNIITYKCKGGPDFGTLANGWLRIFLGKKRTDFPDQAHHKPKAPHNVTLFLIY